ncbi:MAG TPA: hypothetical protein VHW26_01315 [Solirubrobacteraceae bacterium]|jgi:hypothetical protein|nr:hypothetical protein [Solirubrobacteraceae bacterium]
MPVTNSNKGKPLPYIERGGSGLPPKPNPARPVGTLANNAGMAENVGRLSPEELAARGDLGFEFKFDTPAPEHVTLTDQDHLRNKPTPTNLAFGALMGVVKAGVTATGGVRKLGRRK